MSVRRTLGCRKTNWPNGWWRAVLSELKLETIVQEPDTALGDCVTLLEPVAERELTANGERARDVVVDVVDYGQF